jgi:predicted metal-dependent hydrolase
MVGMDTYDPRYLAGILFFNGHDYFEAHEAWEDLWSESHGTERRFYQGLIQAAVALFHFCNGNLGGALKQYRSSYDYMKTCGSPFLGLDVDAFWRQMARCFEPLLNSATPARHVRPDPELLPVLRLDPPPETWPDPEAFLHEE